MAEGVKTAVQPGAFAKAVGQGRLPASFVSPVCQRNLLDLHVLPAISSR